MMNAIQKLCLSKLKLSDKDRDAVAPGEYEETFFAKVTAQVKVGKPYDSQTASSIPWQKLAAHLLSKVNESTRAKVVRDFMEGLEAGTLDDLDAVTDAAQTAVQDLLVSSTKTHRGKVTGSCIVELISADMAEAA